MTIVCSSSELTSIIGEYNDAILKLFSPEIMILPPVLWIEYQEIPIHEIIAGLRSKPELFSSLYFLEVPDFFKFEQIISSELFTINQHGFRTVIVHYPEYCKILPEVQIRIVELTKKMSIIFLLKQKIFTESSCKHIKAEGDDL